jgi:hypothetical protein
MINDKERLMIRCMLSLGLVLLMVPAGWTMPASAGDFPGEIPPELARWRSWVLHGEEEALCPSAYNDGAVVRCQWPSKLSIEVNDDGGGFEQHWQMFAPGWVPLPGSRDLWPDGVAVDGVSAAVVGRDNHPSVRLTPGEHHIRGRFFWTRLPEMLRVPPSVGLIALTVGGRTIASPKVDAQGRLWLQQRAVQSRQEDHLNVKIFRLINDDLPMQITTLLRLDVSGQVREIQLKNVMLPNLVPMALTSQLPARLNSDGALMVQVRPGRWEVTLVGRMPDFVGKLGIGASPHGDEVWSFQPQHHLRMVEIAGVPQVEPGQTEMPGQWRGYAAYLVKPAATMQLKVIRRGDPDPVPDQLTLFRRWWLDFDGKGFTLHDTVDGTLSSQWFLAMNAPVVLGRISVDGRDQVITAQGALEKAGVELRRGELNLESDARLPLNSGSISAVGWDHDFKKVRGELHLPPGWRLMAVLGVDEVSDTWLQRWSLLDFFVVLIIGLGVFKLRGWRWGVLALTAMVLLFHESGAPRLVWLHILAVLALLPLLPDNWVKRVVSLWGALAVVVLLIIAIPFIVNQVRWGFYPQLAHHNDHQVTVRETASATGDKPRQKVSSRSLGETPQRSRLKAPLASAPVESGDVGRADTAIWHQDPDALVPTGPGLPEWHWQTIGLEWNGPVAKDQTMYLMLWSPWVNLVLALLRVALLALFIWGVIDWKSWWRKIHPQLNPVAGPATMLLLLAGAQWIPAHAESQGGFPSSQMLDALKQRLLEPADCLPYCADLSRLQVDVSNDDLRVMLNVHAATRTAIPLPVNRKSWSPDQILLDHAPISGMGRDKKGGLWAVVPSGLHTVILSGSVAQETMVQIPLPLKPHLASYTAKGWSLQGIMPDGTVGSSVQLTRIHNKGALLSSPRDNGELPPFLHVRRELHLGLTWQVSTTIERLTAVGAPVVVNLPLLPHESVTTAGMHVDKGHVLINLSAEQRRASLTSTLKITPEIQLAAPRAVPWTESWVLDASPIWHCDLSGIAVVHHQGRTGQWRPQWQPWPGESVTIKVHRPKAIDGQALTIQNADLTLTPGRRFSRGVLALKIKTSKGGQYTVGLPPKSNLQNVRVKGKRLPVRQDGQWVTVPLMPGLQSIDIQWHQLIPFGMFLKAPLIKIGQEAVNATVKVKMPQKRWILLAGGPRWGPAVLFWSYLAVIILAAAGLGRLTITTLKTWQWVLLGLGLTQIPPHMALIILGWLLALGVRRQGAMPQNWLGFNLLQMGLLLLTLLAIISLFTAVKAGLIGHPDMQIQGNNSGTWQLNWTQDRIGGDFPRPWVLSVPLWIYRGLMLVWSLWLAYALLGWFKWGWTCFAKGGVWQKRPSKPKQTAKSSPQPFKT